MPVALIDPLVNPVQDGFVLSYINERGAGVQTLKGNCPKRLGFVNALVLFVLHETCVSRAPPLSSSSTCTSIPIILPSEGVPPMLDHGIATSTI